MDSGTSIGSNNPIRIALRSRLGFYTETKSIFNTYTNDAHDNDLFITTDTKAAIYIGNIIQTLASIVTW